MASKGLQRTHFDVLGLCCSSEVSLIENILKPLDGVKEVSVIVPTRTLIVVHDNLLVSHLQIVKALNQARLEANVRMYGDKDSQKMWPSPWAIASGLLLVLSLLKYVFPPMQWLALGAVAIGIIPILLKAITALRTYRFYDINILMVIAVIGTIALNDYLEAGTIVFLFTIAEWLQSRASHKTKVVMTSLMSIAPKKAVIAETGEEVDADEVKLNTVIAVKAGEDIPIDGIVMDGNCEVDEKTLTGESFPVAKHKDSTVFAGTMNLNGYISVKTTALAEDCVVAKMAKLVEDAQNNKSGTERIIDKYTKFYTPAVLLISILIAVIPATLRVKNQSHWFHLALVVLVSACPCALILSTPVATFCALTRAACSGLLIKGGNFLEILAKVKVIAFDKTGTITRAEFVVTEFQALQEDVTLNTLLYWVSSIESKSGHPMADAIVDYGKSLSIEPKPENVTGFENFPGEGVHGVIDGNDIYIGSRKIAVRAGCKTVPNLDEESKEGKSVGYIFCGGRLVGDLCVSDACRTGAEQAIKELKSMGIKTAMLTGDCNAAAMHAQKQLKNALEIVHSDLLPEDKAKMIDQFKKEIGPTAMIGDGINDAPALATADIGISMGISGSALASETGNIILMSNDITKIPKAIRLSRRARNKVIQNVILSITTKLAILALSVAGHPLVWAAVLADVGTCLLVILNSMLLLRGVDTPKKKHCCKTSGVQHSHGNQCSKTNGASSHDHHHGSHGNGHHHHHDDHHHHHHDDHHHHHHGSHDHHGTENGHHIQKQCASKCSNDHHRPSEQAKASKSCTEAHHKCMDQGHGQEREKCHSNHCHDHEHIDPDSSDCDSNMCSGDEKKSDHSIIDVVGSDHVELVEKKKSCDDQGSCSNSLKACCKSLDKREVAGCCKSYYVKECCGNKHSHLGRPGHLSGGLTEVVIE